MRKRIENAKEVFFRFNFLLALFFTSLVGIFCLPLFSYWIEDCDDSISIIGSIK